MAEATTEPASYGQPSRKGKKAWRKNVDLSDVHQGLEQVREEILQGGVVAEKASEELFVEDTVGDHGHEERQRGAKRLRADEIIALRSAVPALDQRKRKAVEVPVTGKKQRNGHYVPHRELQRLRAVADGSRAAITADDHDAAYDPWAEIPALPSADLDFLDPPRPIREPKTLKRSPRSLTISGKSVPNVVKPDAGKSYNPLVSDWSALIEREGFDAVETEQKRLAAEAKAADEAARAIKEAAKVEAAEMDLYATDYDSAWESEWEGFQSETERAVHTQKLKGRKTAAQRNKIKARKEIEAKEIAQRKEKERARDVLRIKQIAKEVSAKETARKGRRKSAPQPNDSSATESDAADEVRLRRPRFGKVAVPLPRLEVVLPDELEESLRRLKPEGSLIEDRYRNLLINGKIEARKRRWQWKQPKKARTEKWSYKDWKLK